jgi:DnaJ-class molecular chaperone
MSEQAIVTCPDCQGRKGGAVHLNTTAGGRWEYQKCPLCAGFGTVHPSLAEKYREGEQLREDRKARGMTLRQEAARLGITAKELSDREGGRA